MAICKPYGLEMFGENLQHSVAKYLEPLAERLGNCQTLHQVHRLDKITSGILLLAKSESYHKFLVDKFRQRQIKKSYWALVIGTPVPKTGVIDIPLCEAKVNNRYRITVLPDGHGNGMIKKPKLKNAGLALPAVTEYSTLKSKGNARPCRH